MRALDGLHAIDARLALSIRDLDTGEVYLESSATTPLPVGGLGMVPVVIEAAVQLDTDQLDPAESLMRVVAEDPVRLPGLWRHLGADRLPASDVALLTAAYDDALAANALLDRIGLQRVTRRVFALGMPRSVLLDRYRARRGPDDAPYLALGTASEYASLFERLLRGEIASPAVSAQVAEWLSFARDLSLTGAATGLDPDGHDDDTHGLLFLNRTGREPGVRAEAGAIAGARRGLAFALIIQFSDLSALHRFRVHEVFHTLGRELMEAVH